MLWKDFDIAEREALWPSRIETWGHILQVNSVVSVISGWIAEMLSILLFAIIAVQRMEHNWVRSVVAAYGHSKKLIFEVHASHSFFEAG